MLPYPWSMPMMVGALFVIKVIEKPLSAAVRHKKCLSQGRIDLTTDLRF
jgi:hypothetical protein